MKIKLAKTATCVYLYATGYAVVVHEEVIKHTRIQWVEIFAKLEVRCAFKGRLVFHDPRYDAKAEMALNSGQVCATEPSLNNGSENSKRLEVKAGSFSIYPKGNGLPLYWVRVPELVSDSLTYQPDCDEPYKEEWREGDLWSQTRILKIHKIHRPEEVTAH